MERIFQKSQPVKKLVNTLAKDSQFVDKLGLAGRLHTVKPLLQPGMLAIDDDV